MATAEQIKALLKSYSDGDNEHFLSVAMQIAAHAARNGKGKFAQELRDLIDGVKKRQNAGKVTGAVPIARPAGELAGLLSAGYHNLRLSDMVLSEATRSQLERVIREYRQQDVLRGHGLTARRKLLLIGPPGCGKTMTAFALAGELHLPTLAVQLHGLITKFMGETAAKLHLVFDAMTRTRGVYLFDEFDAIGSNRGARNDVGEIRRVLNSFLQFLEQDESDSIVIAATNYVDMLDNALFRRFDDVIHYGPPVGRQIIDLVQNRLSSFVTESLDSKEILQAAAGLSHAEIVRACNDAAKNAVLEGSQTVPMKELVAALQRRTRPDGGTQ